MPEECDLSARPVGWVEHGQSTETMQKKWVDMSAYGLRLRLAKTDNSHYLVLSGAAVANQGCLILDTEAHLEQRI
jgi:hypothetical protein